MSDYPQAIDYFVDPSRVFIGQNTHSAIVIHGTGGSATQTSQQLGDYFRTNPSEVSSHFGVDRNGVICQYVSLDDGAAANCCITQGYDTFWYQLFVAYGNLNVVTISIEHVNDVNNSLPLTDVQKHASFNLVLWLCQKYGLSFDQVKSHASIDPINRPNCPGNYPWNELKTFIATGGSIVSFVEHAAMNTWLSYKDHNGNTLNSTTGIAQAWFHEYVDNFRVMPPPSGPEYPSIDWSGNFIVVQNFAHMQCVWANGSATWYTLGFNWQNLGQ